MPTYFVERCNGHPADPTGVNQGERRQIKIDVEGKTVEGIAVFHCNSHCSDFGLIPPDTGIIFFCVYESRRLTVDLLTHPQAGAGTGWH